METFPALLALCEGNQASDAEVLCFLSPPSKQMIEQTIEMSVIWDAITLIMTSL